MADTSDNRGTVRDLISDLRGILSESSESERGESLEEARRVKLDKSFPGPGGEAKKKSWRDYAKSPTAQDRELRQKQDAEKKDAKEGVEPVDSVSEAKKDHKPETTLKSDKKSLKKKVKEKRGNKGRGKHNPFKRKANLGKGPRGRLHNQTKKWKCRCTSPYSCMCKNKDTGRNKPITIDRAYKQGYNHQYKSWRKSKKPVG